MRTGYFGLQLANILNPWLVEEMLIHTFFLAISTARPFSVEFTVCYFIGTSEYSTRIFPHHCWIACLCRGLNCQWQTCTGLVEARWIFLPRFPPPNTPVVEGYTLIAGYIGWVIPLLRSDAAFSEQMTTLIEMRRGT